MAVIAPDIAADVRRSLNRAGYAFRKKIRKVEQEVDTVKRVDLRIEKVETNLHNLAANVKDRFHFAVEATKDLISNLDRKIKEQEKSFASLYATHLDEVIDRVDELVNAQEECYAKHVDEQEKRYASLCATHLIDRVDELVNAQEKSHDLILSNHVEINKRVDGKSNEINSLRGLCLRLDVKISRHEELEFDTDPEEYDTDDDDEEEEDGPTALYREYDKIPKTFLMQMDNLYNHDYSTSMVVNHWRSLSEQKRQQFLQDD